MYTVIRSVRIHLAKRKRCGIVADQQQRKVACFLKHASTLFHEQSKGSKRPFSDTDSGEDKPISRALAAVTSVDTKRYCSILLERVV